ncbi:hypothetical protein KP509_09G093200 [Ceratopteris richardii]|uniref:BTB domain-containing protein n=1 Tax=Ceratopteris richardii TaxID=49495 RepID=A0A8T2U6Y7_CERRI|nr:hypothetical protein KP509_09G093200 [Ceratopteris richardii]
MESVRRSQQVVPEGSNQKHNVKQRPSQKHRDRIILCIGGRILQTSKQTLCTDSHSMLAAWVLRHLHDEDEDIRSSRSGDASAGDFNDGDVNENNNVLWIDRDARRFDHVLNYLRNGTIWLEDVASLRAVQEEAVFFGLSGLESLCEERIQALEKLKRQHADEIRQAIRSAIFDFCESHACTSTLSSSSSKGDVLAILRGRRLGASDALQDPVFRTDEDF